MHVRRFHIPGEATRRDYAVYIMVARHRVSGDVRLYVGKTGDNREGCNPVIARAGNHFSFNKLHSQMRNHLQPDEPHEFDFDYFYTTFGSYVPTSRSRDGVELINEMERQLNKLAQAEFGEILNPLKGSYVQPDVRAERKRLVTSKRIERLRELVQVVREFIEAPEQGKAARGGAHDLLYR